MSDLLSHEDRTALQAVHNERAAVTSSRPESVRRADPGYQAYYTELRSWQSEYVKVDQQVQKFEQSLLSQQRPATLRKWTLAALAEHEKRNPRRLKLAAPADVTAALANLLGVTRSEKTEAMLRTRATNALKRLAGEGFIVSAKASEAPGGRPRGVKGNTMLYGTHERVGSLRALFAEARETRADAIRRADVIQERARALGAALDYTVSGHVGHGNTDFTVKFSALEGDIEKLLEGAESNV